MKTRLLAIPLILLFLRAAAAEGQYVPVAYSAANYCPPAPHIRPFPWAPTTPLQTLLYVRIAGPAGMKVTFFRGGNQSVTLDAPCIAGFRPGYFYRIALSGMKQFPGQTFFPTLEVRGSLLLGSSLRACDYPAGLVFKERDIVQALEESLVRKVIFVEKVENALPQSSSPDNPLELIVPRSRDPLEEARDRGLPVLIVEMGGRDIAVEDLLRQAIAGTILLPGDSYLPRPSVIPCLPWSCFPVYDPLLGPAPWLYYTLPDGGDWGEPVGYDRWGRLRGRDPSDTIAEYSNNKGEKKIAISNRVFLCIPRFIVAKNQPIRPDTLQVRTGFPTELRTAQPPQELQPIPVGPRMFHQPRHLELVRENLKAAGIERLQVTAVTGQIKNLTVATTITGPANVTGSPEQKKAPPPPPEAKEAPLKVDKWPDRCGGVVGDVITFFIRVTNVGGQPIRNVVVSDNLISRFKYVPESARSSRAANFTVQPNDVGSSILQWQFDGDLLPGDPPAVVSFRIEIR